MSPVVSTKTVTVPGSHPDRDGYVSVAPDLPLANSRHPMRGKRDRSCTVGAWALLGAALVMLGGACDSPTPPQSSDQDQARNQAMLSIHAHARWGKPQPPPFMDIKDAVIILRNDEGSEAHSRIRRAAAKLWGYGGINTFRQEIKDLLSAYLSPRDFNALVQEIEREISGLPPAEAEALVLNKLVILTGDCPYEVPRPVGGVRPNPPPVEWAYAVYIPRKMHDIARSLDPQKWAKTSTLFYASYLVDTPSSCCPKSSQSDCSYTKKPGTQDPVAGADHAAGQAYHDETFFEHFCVGSNCGACEKAKCDASFKTLLCVTAMYDICVPVHFLAALANRYDVYYHFAAFLSGELDGVPGQAIDTDQGSLSVRKATQAEIQKHKLPPGDWSLVNVSKTLSFKNSGMDVILAKILEASQDELRGQTVEQACHGVPTEWWFFGWS